MSFPCFHRGRLCGSRNPEKETKIFANRLDSCGACACGSRYRNDFSSTKWEMSLKK